MRKGEVAPTILDMWLAPEEAPRMFEAMKLAAREAKSKLTPLGRSQARHFSSLCLREDPLFVQFTKE